MSKKLQVLIDHSEVREGLPPISDQTHCKECGRELEYGFGLAGGGYGTYIYCPIHGLVAKNNEIEDEE